MLRRVAIWRSNSLQWGRDTPLRVCDTKTLAPEQPAVEIADFRFGRRSGQSVVHDEWTAHAAKRVSTTAGRMAAPGSGAVPRRAEPCREHPVHLDGGAEPSFDHLVGAHQQRSWNLDTQRFRGFQVDHEMKPRGLLDR